MVTDIKFYISKDFVDKLYSSCRDVISPSTNNRVMGECDLLVHTSLA